MGTSASRDLDPREKQKLEIQPNKNEKGAPKIEKGGVFRILKNLIFSRIKCSSE